MDSLMFLQSQQVGPLLLLTLLLLWDLVWKAIALWHAARRNQKVWFVFLTIINSLGLLPIVYLIIYRNKRDN